MQDNGQNAKYKKGKVYKYQGLRFWAEGGIVKILDTRDGTITNIAATVWHNRAKAIGDEGDHCNYSDERQEHYDCANAMRACAAEARYQGDPTDASFEEYRVRHKEWLRTTLLVNNQYQNIRTPEKRIVEARKVDPMRNNKIHTK